MACVRLRPWAGLALALWSLVTPCVLPDGSSSKACGASAPSAFTVLLLQKKGPETLMFEVDLSSGGVTDLRKELKLHDHAFSGVALDPARERVHLLTSSPLHVVHTLALRGNNVTYLSNTSLYHVLSEHRQCSLDSSSPLPATCSPASSGQATQKKLQNVWNVAVWEGTGFLIAIMPSDPGFTTSVLLIDPVQGQARTSGTCEGSPVQGIFTFDRKGETYYFVTSAKRQRNLAAFDAPAGHLSVRPLLLEHDSDLIGLHYDEGKCRLFALGWRSPGILSLQTVSSGHSFANATEHAALPGAANRKAKAFELVGMTSLFAGRHGLQVLCRDPRSSRINVYNLDTDQSYVIDVANEGIVALHNRIRLSPQVTSLMPSQVGMAGSSVVRVLGADFGRADTSPIAYIGRTQSPKVVWTSDSTIAVKAPPNPLFSTKYSINFRIHDVEFQADQQLDYVPSWTSLEPTQGSVAGEHTITLRGGRFGMGPFVCKFSGVSNTTEGTAYGVDTVTCPVPYITQVKTVRVDLRSNNVLIKRDSEQVFSFVASDPVRVVLQDLPTDPTGGRMFQFHALLHDVFGNPVLTYQGVFRLQVFLLDDVTPGCDTTFGSPCTWTELTSASGSMRFMKGNFVESAVRGKARFNISIARHGMYKLNVSTEACYCNEDGCSQDDEDWRGGDGGGCETYGARQTQILQAGDTENMCVRDAACQPCACRCSKLCGIDIGGSALSLYGICSFNETKLANSSKMRRIRKRSAPCLAAHEQIEISVGQMAMLNVTRAPNRALAAHNLRPHPRLEVLDSGGNIANVTVRVSVSVKSVGEKKMIALNDSSVESKAGVAVFSEIMLSKTGTFSMIFSTEGGLSASMDIEVVFSSPAFLYNAGLYPSRSHVAMQPLHPSPVIWILDEGGNRIDKAFYWIQDVHGIMAPRPLNVSITASLSSVSHAPSRQVRPNPFGHYKNYSAQPFLLPQSVSEAAGHLYGGTIISLHGNPTPGAFELCPADCSGHGECLGSGLNNSGKDCWTNCQDQQGPCSWCGTGLCCRYGWPDQSNGCAGLGINGLGHVCVSALTTTGRCECTSGWRGVACELPEENISCSEDCQHSDVGYWTNGTCNCLPASHLRVETKQVGIEATFSELFIDVQGKGYLLTFSADGLAPVQSYAFAVETGIARHLYVTVHPINGTGGEAFFNVPIVEIRDAGKNVVTSDALGGRRNISVSLLGNSNGTLRGYLVRLAENGQVDFDDLKVDEISNHIPYKLQFTSEGLIPAFSEPFHVVSGSPYKLGIVQQPHGARGGLPLASQPHLMLLDRGSNRVSTPEGTWSVSAVFQNVTTSGNLKVPFIHGFAQFTDLRIDTLGQTYVVFNVGVPFQLLASEPFNVTSGPPAFIQILVHPGNGVEGVLTPQPHIVIMDGGGNRVQESANVSVRARNSTGFEYAVGYFKSNTGQMNFTNLQVIAPAPSSYQLVFSINGRNVTKSNFFALSVGSPIELRMQDPNWIPSHFSSAGVVIKPQPVIIVVDRAGNRVPDDNIVVSVSLNTSSLARENYAFVSNDTVNVSNGSRCNLSDTAHGIWGKVNVSTLQGIATFTNIDVGFAGSGFRFVFSANSMVGVQSKAFQITAGQVPDSLHVLCHTGTEIAGTVFRHQPILQVLDPGGNRMRNHRVSATVQLTSSYPSFLAGRLSSVPEGDLLSFTDLAVDSAGEGLQLVFEAHGLKSAFSNAITILRGPAVALNVDSLKAVRAFETIDASISLRDQGGNAVSPSKPTSITATLYTVESRSFTAECRGLHDCKSDLNVSLPPNSEIYSVSISLNMSCTDFDSAHEKISAVSVGSYKLVEDQEYYSGPWVGCHRNCVDSRAVLIDFDAVRKFCWDSSGEACRRVLYHTGWNGYESRWEFLTRVAQQRMSSLPLQVQVPDIVNFHPCDGHFVNAFIKARVQYLQPDSDDQLFGNNQAWMSNLSLSFQNVSLLVIDKPFVIGFSADGLDPAFTDVFSLIPGKVKNMRLVQQPGNGSGNAALSPQPVIALMDLGNNTVVHAHGSAYIVSVTLNSLSGLPKGASIHGNSSVYPSRGQALFTDLFVGTEHSQYFMVFRLIVNHTVLGDLGITTTSNVFSVSRGPPSALTLEQEPGRNASTATLAGIAFENQPVIKVVDMSGNFNPEISGIKISADIDKNGGITGFLLGNISAVVISGIASFTDLALDKQGDMYSLKFSSEGLNSISSDAFNIVSGPAHKLVLIRQPSGAKRDLMFATQPAVEIQDIGGNKVLSWRGNVSVSLRGGVPFHDSIDKGIMVQLLGTAQGYLFQGAAYWSNLRVNGTGKEYLLEFNASDSQGTGLQGCVSAPFVVSGHKAVKLVFLEYPTIARSFLTSQKLAVGALDSMGDVDAHFKDFVSLETVFLNTKSDDDICRFDAQCLANFQHREINKVHLKWQNGIALFSFPSILSSASDTTISLKLIHGTAEFETQNISLIDPFTGWWSLLYARDTMQLSMKGQYLKGYTSGIWRDPRGGWKNQSSHFAFISDGGQRLRKREHDSCLVLTSNVLKIDENCCVTGYEPCCLSGEPEGSLNLQQCMDGDTIAGYLSTRTNHRVPDTSWARDLRFFQIQQHSGSHTTEHYVVVANGFNATSSTYKVSSALYKWQNGQLVLHQEFPNTESAYSIFDFEMGAAHWLVIANHFSESKSGFGVPSILYRYSGYGSEYKFVPVQSISTEGAVAWEYFEYAEESYLTVANYFNGTHFAINSTVYKLDRNNPDTSAPTLKIVQSIETNGARDVAQFSIGSTQYLVFANWRGRSVDVYRLDQKISAEFVLVQTIDVGPATGVEVLRTNGTLYLAVSVSDTIASRVLLNAIQIYRFDSEKDSFKIFQNLTSPGIQQLRHFSDGVEVYLIGVEVSEKDNMNARTRVYKLAGNTTRNRFWEFLSLPTRNASSAVMMDVPCNVSGAIGTSWECGTNDMQRLIMAVNGKGRGSEMFGILPLQSSPIATHIEFSPFAAYNQSDEAQRPILNQTIFSSAPPQADIYCFHKRANVSWDVPIQANIQIWSQDSPTGNPVSMSVNASGMTRVHTNEVGSALFTSIKTTSSGVVSLHAYNKYLSDLIPSFSDKMTVTAGAACKLMIHQMPNQIISGDTLSPLISVHDAFGNFKRDSDSLVINASLAIPRNNILLYNNTAQTEKGLARFGIQIFGHEQNIQISCRAEGLEMISSPAFNVIRQASVSDLSSLPIQPDSSATSLNGGGVLFFGGRLQNGVVTNHLMKIVPRTPFQLKPVGQSGKIPPPRYHHAALMLSSPESMIIFGGMDSNGKHYNDMYRLDISSSVWTQIPYVAYTARAQPAAVIATLTVPNPHQPSIQEVFTLIVVFGGLDPSGQPLDDIFLLSAIYPDVVENTPSPPIVSGDKPSSRFGASMTWDSDRGYLMGGQDVFGSDDAVYTFNITRKDQNYYVAWKSLTSVTGTSLPHPLVNSPLRHDGKFYVITAWTANQSGYSDMFAFDFRADPEKVRLLPALPFPDMIPPSKYALAEMSDGRALIFSSNSINFSSRAYLFSLVSAAALSLLNAPPPQIPAGLVVFPAPSVMVVDASGDLVRDSGRNPFVSIFAYDPDMNPIALSGTLTVKAVDGVAVFDHVMIQGEFTAKAYNDKIVQFIFESDSIHGVSSMPSVVVLGPAAKLSFLQAPDGTYKGANFLTQPVVALKDTAGNIVIDNSFTTVEANLDWRVDVNDDWVDKTVWLTGVRIKKPLHGIVSFDDLGTDQVASDGFYRIIVSATGVASSISYFGLGAAFVTGNITGGPGTTAVLSMDPVACSNRSRGVSSACSSYLHHARESNAFIAGVALLKHPQVFVKIYPSFADPSVTVEFKHGTGIFFDVKLRPAIRNVLDLNGTQRQELQNATAIFQGLAINPVGTGFQLEFSSLVLPTARSIKFSIVPGTPASMKVTKDVSDAFGGLAFKQQPEISVSDVASNLIAISVPITASLYHPNLNATLKGNDVANTVYGTGTAIFTDLTIDPIGTGYYLHFALYDPCCGTSLEITDPESVAFSVTQSGPATLEELSPPALALAGLPFDAQPAVILRDFGGNRLNLSGSIVTASIERDSTTRIVSPKTILRSSSTVSKIVHFRVNKKEYLFVANMFNGVSYNINSTLYAWNSTTEAMIEIQQISTQGAQHGKHFMHDGNHYLVVSNGFQEVTNIDGQIEGTYNTHSSIYRMDEISEKLVHLALIPTKGAKSIETMRIANHTMILVSNSYDDLTVEVNSDLYRFNPYGKPYLTLLQQVPTVAAYLFHYFKGPQGEDMVILAQHFDVKAGTYIADSVLYRLREGQLVQNPQSDKVKTSGVVAVKSFYAGSRRYVVVGNRYGTRNVSDAGGAVVYEFVNGDLILRQELTGLVGLTDMEYFHFNGAEWLVITTDPALAGSNSPGKITLFAWDSSNCTTSLTVCDESVNFLVYDRMECHRCLTTVSWQSDADNHYILSASNSGLSFITFFSDGVLLGNTTMPMVDGKVQFNDLYINLKLDRYSLAYRSEGLAPAYGAVFDVIYGPVAYITALQKPEFGFAAHPFSVQPVLEFWDQGGNLLSLQFDDQYTDVSIASSAEQEAAINGSRTALIRNGRAAYTNLAISKTSWHILNFTFAPSSDSLLETKRSDPKVSAILSPSPIWMTINVTIFLGPPHHLLAQVPADFCYGGILFGQQPSFALVDAGNNFVPAASTKVAVRMTSSENFEMMPIGNNSDFEDIDSDGISFFSYRGTGYVVTFGKLATNGSPIMKMFKFGCDSLVPVQTWNASILHIAFWNQNKTAWMISVDVNRECVLYSFDSSSENLVVRGYFQLGGVYKVHPIRLENRLHFVAAVDSFDQNQGAVLLLSISMLPSQQAITRSPSLQWSGTSFESWDNLTLAVSVVQNVTEMQSVSAFEGFSYDYRDWLVVLSKSGNVSVYVWGEYLLPEFKLHQSKKMGNVADMALYFPTAGQPPCIAFAGEQSFLLNLSKPSEPRGISIFTTPVSIPFGARRVTSARKGKTHVLAMASEFEIAILMESGSMMNVVWRWNISSLSTNHSTVSWGWSANVLHLLRAGSSGSQKVFRMEDVGSLAGTTIVSAVNGTVTFTNLQLDLIGNYTLVFEAVGLQNDFFYKSIFDSYQLQSQELHVGLGNPSALVPTSTALYFSDSPAVKILDGGGNDMVLGSLHTRISSPLVSKAENLNVSGSFLWDTSQLMNKSVVLACQAEFPVTPRDGMLWHFGVAFEDKSASAVIGNQDKAASAVLAEGIGSTNTTVKLVAALSGLQPNEYIKVVNYDGQFAEYMKVTSLNDNGRTLTVQRASEPLGITTGPWERPWDGGLLVVALAGATVTLTEGVDPDDTILALVAALPGLDVGEYIKSESGEYMKVTSLSNFNRTLSVERGALPPGLTQIASSVAAAGSKVTLAEKNASSVGAWIGIRDSASSPVLRLRVGLGENISLSAPDKACWHARTCLDMGSMVGCSSTNCPGITYLDISDFPNDGFLHQIVVEIALGTHGSLKIFIDEELKGSVSMHAHAWVAWGMGPHSFALHTDDGQIPVGEPNTDWPGRTSTRLRIYDGSYQGPFCDNALLQRSRRLEPVPQADWVDSSGIDLQYICCVLSSGCPKVTAVIDNPSMWNYTEETQRIFSSGVRDVEHFVIGSRHFVALANSFDGSSYRLDSFLYQWKESKLQKVQSFTTNGAFDFEFFTVDQSNASSSGPGVTQKEHYLAVANHYDDLDGYKTESIIFRWNSSRSLFQKFQSIQTEGAMRWKGFKIDSAQHLVVANFFDGTFHAVNSVVYRFSERSGAFLVWQSIPTIGANSVSHSEHSGYHFLFFSQYRAADEISFASHSPIYIWQARIERFELLSNFASSATMHVEPFQISGALYFAVANYADSTTGNISTTSSIFMLSCNQGVHSTSLVQSIQTYGAVFVKHFTRGGIHYIGVSNWALGTEGHVLSPNFCDGMSHVTSNPPVDCPSSVDLYIWNGRSFELYSKLSASDGQGVYSFDVMLMDSRYYFLSGVAVDRSSSLTRFAKDPEKFVLAYSGSKVDIGRPQQQDLDSEGFFWDGNVALDFPNLDQWLIPYDQALIYGTSIASLAQQHWGVEFESYPLSGTSLGPFAYNASFNLSSPVNASLAV